MFNKLGGISMNKKNWLDGITGIVFDFNGTLVFDAHLHVLSWSEISLMLTGKEMSEEENRQLSGKNNAVIIQMMRPELTPEQNKEYSLKKEAVYRKMVVEQNLPLVPGTIDLFDYLKQNNIPFTIASASIKENIDFFVEYFHLSNWMNPENIRYDDGTYADKIQMFKDAAAAIGSPVESTLIFEDSPTGIRCAHEAGFKHIIQIKKDKNSPSIDHTKMSILDFTELQ